MLYLKYRELRKGKMDEDTFIEEIEPILNEVFPNVD